MGIQGRKGRKKKPDEEDATMHLATSSLQNVSVSVSVSLSSSHVNVSVLHVASVCSGAARVPGGRGLPAARGLRQGVADLRRPLPVADVRDQRRVPGQHPQAHLHLQAAVRGEPLQGLPSA